MSRVEDLEARVAELSAELDGLLDEYMDARRRLHELEASYGSDTAEPDPYGLADDPHAVVIDRSRAAPDGPRSRGVTGGPAAERDGTTRAGSDDGGASHEASQEEVDQAVRRVEGDGDSDSDGDAAVDDGDEPRDAGEHHADDIIVG